VTAGSVHMAGQSPTLGPKQSPIPPSRLKATTISSTAIALHWIDRSLGGGGGIGDGHHYVIHYHAVSGGHLCMTLIARAVGIAVNDLLPGTRYHFKVQSVFGETTSLFSETVTAKTMHES